MATDETYGAAAKQIEDPFLQSILQTAAKVRHQTFELLELIASLHANEADQASTLAPSPELVKAQKNLASSFAVLRGQNRKLAMLVRQTKATTGQSRGEVDTLHLNLQNLYYEQRHLLGEIASCEDFPNPYRKLPLVSEEEFLEQNPEWATKKDEENGDDAGERGFMRARILQEKAAREELESKRKELFDRKVQLAKENAKRKEELSKLDKDLEAFIEAAKPIQKTFERGVAATTAPA